MRKLLLLVLAAVLLVGVVPAFGQDEPGTIAEIVIASTTAETPEFTVLLAAVQAASPAFVEALSNADNQMTVFAPTDAAFGALLAALNVTAEDLLANTALLNVVLSYHIVPASFDAAAVVALDGAIVGTMLPDAPLAISLDGDAVKVNEATVVAADVMASNGVVHVIDSVLLPADAMERAEAMGMMAEMTPDPMMAAPVTLAETVVAATQASTPEFTVLLAAVSAADPSILGMLSSTGNYTVFAPTDAAFGAALTALNVTAEALLADTANLNRILAYHVVPGKFSAATVIAAVGDNADGIKVATMVPGVALTLKVMDGAVMVDGATVVAADVMASNGIVHVIDAVILPPAAQ